MKHDVFTGRDSKEKVFSHSLSSAQTILYALCGLLLTFILWAKFSYLNEMARTDQARISPSSKTQYIQSLDGGILKNLYTQEGTIVNKGDLLAEIDATEFQSKMEQHQIKILSLKIQALRLLSEATGKKFSIPEKLYEQSPSTAQSEIQLHQKRQEELELKVKIYIDEQLGLSQQIQEENSAKRSYEKSLELKQQEHEMLSNLKKSGSVSPKELLDIKSTIAELESQIEQSLSKIEQKQTQKDSISKKVAELRVAFKKEAYGQYNKMKSELSALLKENISVSDKVDRTLIYSPVHGVVHQVLTYTQGGVIKPGETLLEITPMDEKLIVEAKIHPKDIGFITPGMKAFVKVTTYDFSLFGGLDGKVKHISPDVVMEQDQAYFVVKIETEKAYLERQGKKYPIIPGMSAQVDILTGEKTVLQYLMKPIFKAKQQALTER